MSGWECAAGSTLLIPSNGYHLHIIINDPCIFDGSVHEQCILVGISSIKNAPFDTTCIIEARSHDFINQRSYAHYKFAILENVSHVIDMVGVGLYKHKLPVSDELLTRVKNGLYDSPKTKRHIIRLQRAE